MVVSVFLWFWIYDDNKRCIWLLGWTSDDKLFKLFWRCMTVHWCFFSTISIFPKIWFTHVTCTSQCWVSFACYGLTMHCFRSWNKLPANSVLSNIVFFVVFGLFSHPFFQSLKCRFSWLPDSLSNVYFRSNTCMLSRGTMYITLQLIHNMHCCLFKSN